MEKRWLKHYPDSVSGSINVDPKESLVDYLSQRCQQHRHHIAFENFSKTITFAEFEHLSECLAAYLQQKLKLVKGDRFAIMLPNLLQFPIALFAALKAGLVVVNVNPLYTARELIHQLEDSGAKAILVMENFVGTLWEALPFTDLSRVIVTRLGDCLGFFEKNFLNCYTKYVQRRVPHLKIPGALYFLDVMREAESLRRTPVALTGDDIAFLQYTGGTTGTIKAAVLTHTNVLSNVYQCLAWVRSRLQGSQDCVVTALPLYHIFSLTGCLFFMAAGARALLITNPRDVKYFIKILRRHRVTIFLGINTMFNSLMHQKKFSKIDFSHLSLVISGGMALQKPVADQWQHLTGSVILEGYGLTEASPVVTINPLTVTHFTGSIGMPISSTDIQIRDKEGREVDFNCPGELWVRGPQVMQGYWKKPEETALVLDAKGWLCTGDIAYVNEQGMVFVVDRKKDMIIVSGFNVYPNEVEEVIMGHPRVKEVAVIGIPSKKTGESVKAFIVSQGPLTAAEVIAFCQKQLTHYKIPKSIEFRQELPKSNVGKILRRALRE